MTVRVRAGRCTNRAGTEHRGSWGAAGLKKRTADNYTKLLEALFLVYRLPAWGRTLRARTASLPKLHVADPGLAAQLGHLLETFVVGEVRKQVSWMEPALASPGGTSPGSA